MKRLTRSTVLIVVLGSLVVAGGAVAADHWIITSISQIKPSVLKLLVGQRGPRGERGFPGPQGLQGRRGVPGPSALALYGFTGTVTLAPGQNGQAIAYCASGQVAVTGGYTAEALNADGTGSQPGQGLVIYTDYPVQHIGAEWPIAAINHTTMPVKINAYVYCAVGTASGI